MDVRVAPNTRPALRDAHAPEDPLSDPLEAHALRDPLVQRKIEADSFGGLIREQRELQQRYEAGELTEKHTTVGFEHEFAQMPDSALSGLSHVEVSKSRETLPVTNLPFVLETDASDALELVTPPFLLETLPDRPIPLPSELRKAEALIHASLDAKTSKKDQTLGGLVHDFRANEGLTFPLADTRIGTENLSARYFGGLDYDGTPLVDKPNKETSMLKRATLASIGIVPSKKSGGGEAQANFATDSATAVEMTGPGAYTNKYVQAFLGLERSLRGLIDPTVEACLSARKARRTAGLDAFLTYLVRVLAGQASVPFIHAQRRANEAMKRRGVAVATALDGADALSSFVKDTGRAWVKDTVYNIGLGLLRANEWRHVYVVAGDKGLLEGIRNLRAATGHLHQLVFDLELDYDAMFNGAVIAALEQLRSMISSKKLWAKRWADRKRLFLNSKKRRPFLSHKRKWIGPRQDTYIRGQHVQMPDMWDARLHVVETRRDFAETLKWMEGLDPRLKGASEDDEQAKDAQTHDEPGNDEQTHDEQATDPGMGQAPPAPPPVFLAGLDAAGAASVYGTILGHFQQKHADVLGNESAPRGVVARDAERDARGRTRRHEKLWKKYQKGMNEKRTEQAARLETWAADNEIAVARNGGRGNNCLIISLLQHATGDYASDHHAAAAYFRGLLVQERGVPANGMLYADDRSYAWLVQQINEAYGVSMNPVFVQADQDGEPFVVPEIAVGAHPVVIWDQGGHYEALRPAG